MPRGDNPNSRANLKKSYGGTGKMSTETARKVTAASSAKRTAVKKLREEANRELINSMYDDASNTRALELIKKLAFEGDPDMLKLYVKISGLDKTDLEVKRAKCDIAKSEAETKRIKSDEKRIKAETKLIELKIATPEEAEDDGFFDAIEGRLPEVWGGDNE